jgi:uncharacterized protein YjbJ (UPF0337 family)
MRPSTENEGAGKFHEVKGAIKEKMGHVMFVSGSAAT